LSSTQGKRRNWDPSKNRFDHRFNQLVIGNKAWVLELGMGNEVGIKTKPHRIKIEPHSEDARQHNTTLHHDKSTRHNLTTSIHHDRTTPHNEVITPHHDKTHHVRTTLQDIMKKPQNIMKYYNT